MEFTSTPGNVLCCMCGIVMQSNPANMCLNCIRSRVDISEGIPKQVAVQWCKFCERYMQPPSQWMFAALESRELLTFCLKRLRGLNKVKLVDAGFVWTEPHSRRLKVKLTVEKEVYSGAILQQAFVVEYVVNTHMCPQCQKAQTEHTWVAVCQARQKVDHKRSFFYLEQLILKHNANQKVIAIKEETDGLDFYFNHRSHCMKFVDFLSQMLPIRYKTAEQLISQDDHNNTYNYKYTFSVEIAPICRDDVVCLPTKLAQSCGNITPLVLCTKVHSVFHFIDPWTLQVCELQPGAYWKQPFTSILTRERLIQYMILDITPLDVSQGKMQLAEVQVARMSDFGSNDTTFMGRTHLGGILNPGDVALGFDVTNANFNDESLKPMRGRELPYFILVKKHFVRPLRQRIFKLKNLDVEMSEGLRNQKKAEEKREEQYEAFLNDIEEDPELRSTINLYKAPNAEHIAAAQMGADDEDVAPQVALEELLDDLNLDDVADKDTEMED